MLGCVLNANPFTFKQQSPPKGGLQSTKLLIQMGFIQMQGAGLYTYLPLGLRVLQKISDMIRKELEAADFQELLVPTMQPGELWNESGRLTGAYGEEKLTVQDRGNRTLVYGPTAEESVTDIFRRKVQSHKQLPLVLYNIQTKFRDEIRPRYGVLRAREFIMLDAYSFQVDTNKEVYDHITKAYLRILCNLGFNPITAEADTGEMGGSWSHELLVENTNGESVIGVRSDGSAIVLENGAKTTEEFTRITRGTEVGHNFFLGDTYSKKMNATVDTDQGNITVQMGCYGIGVSRLLGVLAEFALNDHLIWPKSFAPYDISLILLQRHPRLLQIIDQIKDTKLNVLVDDRPTTDLSQKLSDAEKTGIPLRIVLGERELEAGTLTARWYQDQHPDHPEKKQIHIGPNVSSELIKIFDSVFGGS